MSSPDTVMLRELARKEWHKLPAKTPVWVRFTDGGGRLFRFIIRRNDLASGKHRLVLEMPLGPAPMSCHVAGLAALLVPISPPYRKSDTYATHKGLTLAYVS